jgi:hypothetical protein
MMLAKLAGPHRLVPLAELETGLRSEIASTAEVAGRSVAAGAL